MPLIKRRTERTTFVRHITQLYAENQEELYAYAAFIGDSPAYVLNALIDTLKKDPDYKAWRTDHPHSCVPAVGTSKRGTTRAARGVSAAQRAGIATLPSRM
jgi:hypothetical protein